MLHGIEPGAALPPVDPDEEEPEGEAEPVAAGTAGVAIADPVAIGFMADGAALDWAAPGAPGGGMATMDMAGDAAPAGEEDEPEPMSEPSPVTVGVSEPPAEALGDEPAAPDEGEAPELPEFEPAGLALPQLPFIPVSFSFRPASFWTDLPGLGKIGSTLRSGKVSQPLPAWPMLALNRSGKVSSRLKISSEASSWVSLNEASST